MASAVAFSSAAAVFGVVGGVLISVGGGVPDGGADAKTPAAAFPVDHILIVFLSKF